MAPRSKTVKGDAGLDIHLLEWSQQGVALLLLHGFGNDAHIWDDFAPEVAPHYRTLAMDHRGHGDSAWDPDGAYDHDTMLRDVEAVTAALEIDRMVLVGHSLGGRISTLFAGAHPERLAGLVLVDIGPELDARGIMRIRQETGENVDPSFADMEEYERLLSLHYPAATPGALRRMAQHGLRRRDDGRYVLKMDPALRGAFGATETPEEAIEREREMIEAQWKALEWVQCPTLVVRGAASDVFSPEIADRMVDDVLANGRLAVVPQAGHSVMTDNPSGFNDAVLSFVLEG